MSVNIVALGGGTGLPQVLRALKDGPFSLSAIVNMADDGGSSGRLREALDALPPGDIRNCLFSLANNQELSQVFNYRFKHGELDGHSFGNLAITASALVKKDFMAAIRQWMDLLDVRLPVWPCTLTPVTLCAQLEDGRVIEGQRKVASTEKPIERVFLEPDTPEAYSEALSAINNAQYILLGPGSFFSSLIPILLVPEIKRAIQQSKAQKVLILNTFNLRAESCDFTGENYLRTVEEYLGATVDMVIANDISALKSEAGKLMSDGIMPVVPPLGHGRLISADVASEINLLQHDPRKLRKLFSELFSENSSLLGSASH